MHSFNRQNRVRKAEEFRYAFSKGKKRHLNGITMIACRNNTNLARIGFAISKKQIKTAVARNRLKRIAKEEFRENKQYLQGLDFIILVTKTCLNYDKAIIHQSYYQLFNQFISFSKV